MIKLLNASFYRLRKNKIFLGCVLITFAIALFSFISADKNSGIDIILTKYITMIGIFLSLFTSLFVGMEYASGAIRNKIIVKHNRMKIYMSNLIVTIIVGLLLQMLYMISIYIIGLITSMQGLELTTTQFLYVLLDMIMIIVSYSSIFTFVSMSCSDMTLSTVINIIIIIVMYVMTGIFSMDAHSEKYLYNTYYEDDKLIKEIIDINPNYPGDTRKEISKTILYTIPVGQADELFGYISNTSLGLDSDLELENLYLYSLGVIVIVNLFGLYCFNKKDFK